MLKSAGMTPREVDLLKEIAELKRLREAVLEEKKKREIEKQIRQNRERKKQKVRIGRFCTSIF